MPSPPQLKAIPNLLDLMGISNCIGAGLHQLSSYRQLTLKQEVLARITHAYRKHTIKLSRPQCDMLPRGNVHPSSEHHRESTRGAGDATKADRGMVTASQEVRERSKSPVMPPREYGPE